MKFTQKYENVLHMIQGIWLALDKPNPYPNPTRIIQGWLQGSDGSGGYGGSVLYACWDKATSCVCREG